MNSDALTSSTTPESAPTVMSIRRPSRTSATRKRSAWRRRYPAVIASVAKTMKATNDAANPSPG
jgi:hypothetical protein